MTAYEMRISDWSSDVCSSDLDDDLFARLRHRISTSLEQFPIVGGFQSRLCQRQRRALEQRGFFAELARGLVEGRIGEERSQTDVTALPGHRSAQHPRFPLRSEKRGVGEECVSTCRIRGVPDH